MRLHLGSGGIHLEGWVNIDRRYQPGVDRVENIGILNHFPIGEVDEIYICHALDHFTRWEYKNILGRYHDLLRPGGVLRIATPDFAWTATQYAETGKLEDLIGQLYAGQDYPDNVRHFIFDFRTVDLDLRAVGFRKVELYDPVEFLKGQPSDCSTFTDAKGRYRSLCVAATK